MLPIENGCFSRSPHCLFSSQNWAVPFFFHTEWCIYLSISVSLPVQPSASIPTPNSNPPPTAAPSPNPSPPPHPPSPCRPRPRPRPPLHRLPSTLLCAWSLPSRWEARSKLLCVISVFHPACHSRVQEMVAGAGSRRPLSA